MEPSILEWIFFKESFSFHGRGRAVKDLTILTMSELLQLEKTQKNFLDAPGIQALPDQCKRIADSHGRILKELERRKLMEETKKQLKAKGVNQQSLSTFEWNADDWKQEKAADSSQRGNSLDAVLKNNAPKPSCQVSPSNELNAKDDGDIKKFLLLSFKQQTVQLTLEESVKLFEQVKEYHAKQEAAKRNAEKRWGFPTVNRKKY